MAPTPAPADTLEEVPIVIAGKEEEKHLSPKTSSQEVVLVWLGMSVLFCVISILVILYKRKER